MRFLVFVLFLVMTLTVVDLEGRSFRVNQIPNGAKFGCTNCHTGFGGPRNAFGNAVNNGFLDNGGNVVWGPALAALDSDGDGASNGAELQDPMGAWKIGNPNPGDPALVSNPGDPQSTTRVQVVNTPAFFKLFPNHPNPFNPSTTLTFSVSKPASVRLTVYDLLGKPVRRLVDGEVSVGEHSVQWDGRDESGTIVDSGLYLARFEGGSEVQTIRMVLLK